MEDYTIFSDSDLSGMTVLQSRNWYLLLIFIFTLLLCLLPVLSFYLNVQSSILGLPTAIVWLCICYLLFLAQIILAYRVLFNPWSTLIDKKKER
jgi:membrane-associated HD superfamily phosphohydrolase